MEEVLSKWIEKKDNDKVSDGEKIEGSTWEGV